MSATVAAASARLWHVKILRQVGRTIGGPTGAHMLASAECHEQRLAAAGRVIVAASNAAGAGRVRRPPRLTDLCPTWLGGAWVWSTAAHDPRPCAWPRPFARGA